ncbi:hypothetical protein BDN71DRAFT_774241 [Pleurotus eryngii]|uniref:Uncharacterized protein n=1 Tax=Pleurotus eryngii TaxID=5323 RepID=A0A9P6A2Y9_PLEER|nr:hypothetical protein BDN71DRAFT_774241 [Pleurotus eryngii]
MAMPESQGECGINLSIRHGDKDGYLIRAFIQSFSTHAIFDQDQKASGGVKEMKTYPRSKLKIGMKQVWGHSLPFANADSNHGCLQARDNRPMTISLEHIHTNILGNEDKAASALTRTGVHWILAKYLPRCRGMCTSLLSGPFKPEVTTAKKVHDVRHAACSVNFIWWHSSS